ncbi:MAG: 23S rRNA (guanosine(2251)-2'-O)-methyltransferase RlmB [Epsilonproteobacteria bacterium]|nr:23S rRNA (guanosine(2251)-2'-O)-methyltransferase RlmB [Campylobacterota bacterium]
MIVYGKQVCKTLLSRHPEIVTRLYLAKEIAKGEFAAIRRLNLPIERLDAKKAQALARGGNHQGWLCEVAPYVFARVNDLKREDFLVVLAGVTDVGNIGAIVRSAYALGADGVIVAGIRQLAVEGVARSSAGALFDLPVAVEPRVADLLNELKQVGFTLFGADAEGEDLECVTFPKKRVLVLGSEGAGIPSKVRGKIDTMVSIAMARPFDSLNVSAAAAILIYRMRDA